MRTSQGYQIIEMWGQQPIWGHRDLTGPCRYQNQDMGSRLLVLASSHGLLSASALLESHHFRSCMSAQTPSVSNTGQPPYMLTQDVFNNSMYQNTELAERSCINEFPNHNGWIQPCLEKIHLPQTGSTIYPSNPLGPAKSSRFQSSNSAQFWCVTSAWSSPAFLISELRVPTSFQFTAPVTFRQISRESEMNDLWLILLAPLPPSCVMPGGVWGWEPAVQRNLTWGHQDVDPAPWSCPHRFSAFCFFPTIHKIFCLLVCKNHFRCHISIPS